MQARMSNPAMAVPGAMEALTALAKTTKKSRVRWNRLNAATRQVAGQWGG
jgi:hypothetical protein